MRTGTITKPPPRPSNEPEHARQDRDPEEHKGQLDEGHETLAYSCSYNRTALIRAKRRTSWSLTPYNRMEEPLPATSARSKIRPQTRRKGRWGGYRPLLKTLQLLEGGFRY